MLVIGPMAERTRGLITLAYGGTGEDRAKVDALIYEFAERRLDEAGRSRKGSKRDRRGLDRAAYLSERPRIRRTTRT
jgi:hypothetical protein